jgi:ATP-binding cassette, subfamily B, bacterial
MTTAPPPTLPPPSRSAATAAAPRERNPLALAFALARHRPALLVVNCLVWVVVHASPVLYGVFMKGIFDALSGQATAATSPWTFLALALSVDVLRIGTLAGGVYVWSSYWAELVLMMRRNLLGYLLTAPGSRRLPDSPSEAISRFRDDVNDVGEYIEHWVDFWGFALFAVVALAVMFRVDPLMTALICVPLGLTLVFSNLLRPHIRRVRRAMREATGRVTDFIGETFNAVQAVQGAGREESVLGEFERLNTIRRRTALSDSLLAELFKSVNDNMVNIATGVILLLGAGAMQRGAFTVGDFALFVTFLPRLTSTISFLGAMMVQHKRTGIAFERLTGLLGDAGPEVIVADADLHLKGDGPAFVDVRPEHAPLESLRVDGLRSRHGDGAVALDGVSFELARGSFTVVTGRVGSGKSTLVRVLMGLLPREGGDVWWNGALVEDPASWFVPPRSAYTSQVPRLFSDTLRENVTMGRDGGGGAIDDVIRLAVMEHDLEALHRGLDTEVGSRGVRLSGGQVQRSAAARMFMRDADLLVFDDLSSALDVETERQLWNGLWERRAHRTVTCLVVSHRRAALERADQVLVMDGGRIVARGTLEEVVALSPEMADLWGDAGAEGDEAHVPAASAPAAR